MRTLVFLLLLSCVPRVAQPQIERRRILVLYEVGTAYPGINLNDQGMRSAFDASHEKLEIYREYMETVLFPDPADQQRFREFYIRKYKDRRPDVIITVGPSPLKFMVETHKQAFPGVPIVFCQPTWIPNTPPSLDSDFTGAVNDLAPTETLEMAVRLRPDTKHVVVAGGTSYIDAQIEDVVKQQLKPYESRYDISYLTNLTMPDLLERLRHLPDHTIVLHTSLSRDAQGTRFIAGAEATSMITGAANAPVFVMYETFLNHGEVGGKVFSHRQQGRLAGELALRILHGEKPQDIPKMNGGTIFMFDWRALKRWGMKESALPPGSIVLNREPGFWELYGQYVLAGIVVLLAQTAAILGLLWQRKQKRNTEAELRKSEEKFAKAFRESPLAVNIASTSHDRYIEVNETFEQLTGWSREELQGRSPSEINLWVKPEQRIAFLNELLAQGTVRDLEVRIRRKDGQIRTTIGSAELIEVEGDPCALSVITDITERKQAEEALASMSRRLIEAQEQERTRIARELHDDINQRIALLSVELAQLQQSIPGSGLELRSRIDVLKSHLTEVGIEVQAISHRLHSSKLEYLGLVAACKSFCREVAERNKVTVDFVAEDIPSDVAQDVSLCLFRILQESLNNAIKHSGVKRFEVHLLGISGQIQLTVRDAGVGFNAETAMNSQGLGLISMRERANLVKGSVLIRSKPMDGTEISVRVPMVPQGARDMSIGAA